MYPLLAHLTLLYFVNNYFTRGSKGDSKVAKVLPDLF